MSDTLKRLRSLPRSDLIREIRRAAGDDRILLWEQVGYGDTYDPVRAGVEAAAKLGVLPGVVIGYILTVERPMGSALGDLMNAVPQDSPPYPDPFRAW
jgi:hypothetical protein